MQITAAEPTAKTRPSVTVEGDTLVIKMKLGTPIRSGGGTGKSILLATYSGELALQVDGKQVKAGLNVYIPVN